MDEVVLHKCTVWFVGRELLSQNSWSVEKACAAAQKRNKNIRMIGTVFNDRVRFKPRNNEASYELPAARVIRVIKVPQAPGMFCFLMSSSEARYSCYVFSVFPQVAAPEEEFAFYRREIASASTDYLVLRDVDAALALCGTMSGLRPGSVTVPPLALGTGRPVGPPSPNTPINGLKRIGLADRCSSDFSCLDAQSVLSVDCTSSASGSSATRPQRHPKDGRPRTTTTTTSSSLSSFSPSAVLFGRRDPTLQRTASYSVARKRKLSAATFTHSLKSGQEEEGAAPTSRATATSGSPSHSNCGSARRLKRLSSFFRRANLAQQVAESESSGSATPNAPGTVDGRPSTRTSASRPRLLKRRQSIGNTGLGFSSDKENIAPQSMPDSAPEDQKVDLEKILKSESARAPFQNFLQQQFCIENLNFYLAVEDFKLIKDDAERREFGRQIYERHFTPNSIEPVNIDNATSKGIVDSIQKDYYAEDLYDVAQYQIFHLLKYDCWPRYLNSGCANPVPKEGGVASKKDASDPCAKKGASSGTLSARSTNSAVPSTSSEKREKRKSFFRFLRRNKDVTQDQSTECEPCTSSKGPASGGVYGESEPYAGSVGELNLSLSPATTKRRMTRERSVPAPSSRSAEAAPLASQSSEERPQDAALERRTRPATARDAPSDSPSLSASGLASCSKSARSLSASNSDDNGFVSDPHSVLLHDEKEPCSSCSAAATRASAARGPSPSRTTPAESTNGAHLFMNNTTGNQTTPPDAGRGPPCSRLPALYTSAVRSDRDSLTSLDSLAGFKWQKADYV